MSEIRQSRPVRQGLLNEILHLTKRVGAQSNKILGSLLESPVFDLSNYVVRAPSGRPSAYVSSDIPAMPSPGNRVGNVHSVSGQHDGPIAVNFAVSSVYQESDFRMGTQLSP